MKLLEKLGITPGPWMHIAVNGGWDGVGINNCVICNLQENNPINADLIAAAPEMLEALIEFLIHTEYRHKIQGGFGTYGPLYTKTKNSIEKATGKTWDEIIEILNEEK